jgi:hypothetical protein
MGSLEAVACCRNCPAIAQGKQLTGNPTFQVLVREAGLCPLAERSASLMFQQSTLTLCISRYSDSALASEADLSSLRVARDQG